MARFNYTENDIDDVINELISVDNSLKDYYTEFYKKEYTDCNPNRRFYSDIASISRYIVHCTKTRKINFFDKFFDKIEHIITHCDSEVENLLVVGLFEGIQNIGGREIDYYFGFDKWLKPTSKAKWDNLIDNWEGKYWRTREKYH